MSSVAGTHPTHCRNAIVVTAAISLLGTVLTLFPNFYTLIAGRAIQGLCVGLYSALVPLYINEISPMEVAGRLGALNQLLIVSGIVITNVLALFVPSTGSGIVSWWRIIFGIPIAIAIVQILMLLLVYKNETPRYLILQGRDEDALELVRDIYKEEYVDDMIREKKAECREKSQNMNSVISNNEEEEISSKTRKLCIIVAIHLAALQQMCGVNVVVLYGGSIINEAVKNDFTSKLMQVFLIATQFIACLGTSMILKKIGRKSLLQIGTLVSFIVLTTIGVAFVAFKEGTGQQILIIVSLYVFMTSFGFTLGPVVWLYIPEIVPASVVPFSTLANWAAASITIILFPILGDAIGQFGYLFFMFSVWCLGSLLFNHRYVVETMGKTERQIKREFERIVEG